MYMDLNFLWCVWNMSESKNWWEGNCPDTIQAQHYNVHLLLIVPIWQHHSFTIFQTPVTPEWRSHGAPSVQTSIAEVGAVLLPTYAVGIDYRTWNMQLLNNVVACWTFLAHPLHVSFIRLVFLYMLSLHKFKCTTRLSATRSHPEFIAQPLIMNNDLNDRQYLN